MATESALASCPYQLVDIGANLGHPSYRDDLDEVIDRARRAGLVKIMITGTSESLSKAAAGLAAERPGFFYFTAGVHPHDAKEWGEGTEAVIRELLARRECVAVGECGLDYNRDFSPRDVQRDVFREQVSLACELQRPLFIHEREAAEDVREILKAAGASLPPAVIHCYTGTAADMKEYLDMGLYIGLTGFLWKDKSADGVQHALKSGLLPLDRLVLETDAPYMYCKIGDKKLPKEVREGISEEAKALHKFSSFNRNEPCALAAICELVAGFMGEKPEEVARRTTENAKKVYGLE